MSDSAVESTIAQSVNAGHADGESVSKESLDTVESNGHTTESGAAKKKAESSGETGDVDKASPKKVAKEKKSDDGKAPTKRKAKAIEQSSDDETEDKSTTPPKKKTKTESKDSSESESDEEAEKSGLMDKPVVLADGVKREKKKVQRLDVTPVVDPGSAKGKIEIHEGSGTKLGDIPRIELQISKTNADELKKLHQLLYDRVAPHSQIKKNIRSFSGFSFSNESPEYQKKKAKFDRLTLAIIKNVCERLDVERKGTKEEIIERILSFLLKPQDSGKELPKKRRRSSLEKTTKSKKSKSKKPKAKKKPAKTSTGASEDTDKDDENESNASESEHEDAADSEDDGEKKKAVKKSTPKKVKAAEKPKKIKQKQPESPKKKQASPKKLKQDSANDDSGDDEPLAKKAASPPTDKVLKGVIKQILKTANLEEVTMKTVCKQVYDKYPEFDLTSRKEFIKTMVKQILK